MIDRATRLRFRRVFRRRKRQVEDIGLQAEESLDRHFFRRLTRLAGVLRFVVAWLLLLALLISGLVVQTRNLSRFYQISVPAPGGTYTEGLLGSYTNANPLYADTAVDLSVSRLVFVGLLKYDSNNLLVSDLAETWSMDSTETTYTVVLRPNLTWHDGQPLTSADVVFTYQTIQNPDAKSSLLTSWQGITVAAVDERTVTFKLQNALSAFPYSLTTGLVPQHILKDVPAEQMRSVPFNTAGMVGAGPFRFDTLEITGSTEADREETIGLLPFENYHLGESAIGQFIIRSFRDVGRLTRSFEANELQAVVGLENLPSELTLPDVKDYNVPVAGGVYVFFNNTGPLFKDPVVRKAMTRAADPPDIIRQLGYPLLPLDGPILRSHNVYSKDIVQPSQSIDEANKLLHEAGWLYDDSGSGVRLKDGQPLAFRLYSQSTNEYQTVTRTLKEQWKSVGADVEVILQSDQDLQNTISIRNYDALLYGVTLGNDPDVFVYWHSSQADVRAANRLNFSDFSSKVADQSLEAGRTRSDPSLRAIKYKPFLENWRGETPALALYQPRFLYVVRGPLFGFEPTVVVSGADRYANVHQWMIRQEKVNK